VFSRESLRYFKKINLFTTLLAIKKNSIYACPYCDLNKTVHATYKTLGLMFITVLQYLASAGCILETLATYRFNLHIITKSIVRSTILMGYNFININFVGTTKWQTMIYSE